MNIKILILKHVHNDKCKWFNNIDIKLSAFSKEKKLAIIYTKQYITI